MATPKPESSDQAAVLKYSDQLYRNRNWKELLDYLQSTSGSTNDPDLLWRLVRCAYRLGKQTFQAGDPKEAERIVDMAMEHAQKGLAQHERHYYLHKWTGILFGLTGDIKGIKVKIETSYAVRDHFLKAIDIEPDEPDVKHLMGRWCYQVASVPWYQRKMASALLATPPTSSYEEALTYFDGAEKAKPGFFKTNWLWLGKTYYQLSRRAEAREWLQKLLAANTNDPDDDEAKVEAQQFLPKV